MYSQEGPWARTFDPWKGTARHIPAGTLKIPGQSEAPYPNGRKVSEAVVARAVLVFDALS